MHIPNGYLDPKISTGLSLASAGALAYCFFRVREAVTSPALREAFAGAGGAIGSISGSAKSALSSFGNKLLLKMAIIASLIFLAQMFDFPVIGGTTGHLLGCAFAAITLGPWAGAVAMSTVLVTQSLFLGDGGMLALGANIFNMAIIGTVGSYYIYVAIRKKIAGRAGLYMAIAIASWISVVAAAAATGFEVQISGAYQATWALSSMISVHAIVGMAEALVNIAVLGLLGKHLLDDK